MFHAVDTTLGWYRRVEGGRLHSCLLQFEFVDPPTPGHVGSLALGLVRLVE